MDNSRKDIHNSSIPLVCLSCEARHKGVCGALSPEQLTKLSKHTNRFKVENNKVISSPDEDDKNFANILSGVVKLTKLMADGRQQIVGLQFAPDLIGRPFMKNSTVTAEAATDINVCSFPKKILEELLKESPQMEHRLHEQTLRELDDARDWLLTLGRKSAIEKIASFLYLIATHIDPEKNDGKDQITLEMPMKRGDIADFLGLTIETVSRQLTNLRKRNIIEIPDRRSIVIPSIKRLKNAMEQDLSK
ncbi:MAG: transcriptional regulator [Hyphomicrobiales bacterium]|nr:Crp/Fnr family transcriptional regulator [Hyphomicrobiales bacterium]PCH49944.1 MAG: transcriptional regulator [Hyphomicrobiales bacterium]